MAKRTFDESGELVQGYFYELQIEFQAGRRLTSTAGCVVSAEPSGKEFLWAKLVSKKRQYEHECSISISHVTRSQFVELSADIFGPSDTAMFVPADGFAIINGTLERELRNSELAGAKAVAVQVRENQSGARQPRLFHLLFPGRDPCRKPRIVPDSANKCPLCGYGPLFCPECGAGILGCTECDGDIFVLAKEQKGESDPRIRIDPMPALGPIVDTDRWDGSDFLGSTNYGLITRRALDFLLQIHAFPFLARPLRTNIKGLTEAQLKHLETAKKLPA